MDLEELINGALLSDTSPEARNDPGFILSWLDTNDRHIWINDDVSWENDEFIVRYIDYINRHDRNIVDPKPIYLHIFSGGGALTTMFTLYDTIKNSRVPVYTINEGAAHSAAFIIFLAGHRRYAKNHAVCVAHEGSAQMGGSYRESKAAMKAYERDVEEMKRIIAAETKLTPEEIEHHFEESQDWYLYHDDLVEVGVITHDYKEIG